MLFLYSTDNFLWDVSRYHGYTHHVHFKVMAAGLLYPLTFTSHFLVGGLTQLVSVHWESLSPTLKFPSTGLRFLSSLDVLNQCGSRQRRRRHDHRVPGKSLRDTIATPRHPKKHGRCPSCIVQYPKTNSIVLFIVAQLMAQCHRLPVIPCTPSVHRKKKPNEPHSVPAEPRSY